MGIDLTAASHDLGIAVRHIYEAARCIVRAKAEVRRAAKAAHAGDSWNWILVNAVKAENGLDQALANLLAMAEED